MGIVLTCDSCGYTWTYNGRHTVNATCPDCKNSTVKISD